MRNTQRRAAHARGRSMNVRERTVAFSPDGRWLLTAGDDNTARIWAPETDNNLSRSLTTTWWSGWRSAWMELVGYCQWRPYRPNLGCRQWTTTHHVHRRQRVAGVAFSPDGHWLATASRRKTALIWALDMKTTDDPARVAATHNPTITIEGGVAGFSAPQLP